MVFKDQQLHELGRNGQPTLRALNLKESERWLEHERKADAEDPDDGLYESGIRVFREHEHQPKPQNFRLPDEYKDNHGRLVPRIKGSYDGPCPNLFKFARMMEDFIEHQEIENLRQEHHVRFLERQFIRMRQEVASCRALFNAPKAIRTLKRADVMMMYHEDLSESDESEAEAESENEVVDDELPNSPERTQVENHTIVASSSNKRKRGIGEQAHISPVFDFLFVVVLASRG